MSWMKKWLRRVSYLFGKGRAEAEITEEMRLHIELETRDRIQAGMSPEEARRTARRDFGGIERHRERVREARGAAALDDLFQDVRYALRTLRTNPGFTVVALVTVALGVGATTAIFSVVHGVLLEPLPYPESDELVRVHASWEGNPVGNLSPGEHFDFLEGLQAFEAFGTYVYGNVTLPGDEGPRRLPAAFVSAGVLEALDVEPVMGRVFGPGEDGPSSSLVLVSHGFWQRELGGDPAALDRPLMVTGGALDIVGVLPPSFLLPEDVLGGAPAQLVAPLGLDPTAVQSHGSHYLLGVGRLRSGVSVEEGHADVARVGEWIFENFGEDYGGDMAFGAMPLAEHLVGDSRSALLALMAAAGFVLLIACANTANLLLARADARRKDYALRSALGAPRSRIMRQVLVESLVLGLLGGALGIAVAYGGVSGLVALDPPDVPRLAQVSVDGAALAFALTVSAATGLLFGLLPALQVTGEGFQGALRDETRGNSGGRVGKRSRGVLVVGETAFAVVLLTGAALFARSFVELLSVDPGVELDGVLTARVVAGSSSYPTDDEVRAFYQAAESRLQGLSGVEAAGAVVNLPLDRGLGDMGIELEGQPIPPGGDKPAADWQVVTPGYFEAMGTTLVRGRTFDSRDHADAPGAAVINETMARRFWPDQNPLGRRFRLGGGSRPGWVTVVGVVQDVTHDGLDVAVKPQFFVPHRQFTFWNGGSAARGMALVLRASGPTAPLIAGVRRVMGELDPQMAVSDFRTMSEIHASSISRPRFLVSLLGAFGALALLLASVGIYGVISYGVRRRVGEFGIRMALGARSGRVVSMVVSEGARLIVTGLVLGVVIALSLGRLVSGLLFGVAPGDPVTLVTVVGILGAVGLAATLLPAWRATRIDPVRALRTE